MELDLHIIDLARELVLTVLIISGPIMLVGLVVGLSVSLFQALTSVQEQTLSFVPKMLAVMFTTLLLRFGSGVANLAPSQRERYGDREDYREYVASTPLLLPFMKPFYAGRSAEDAPEDLVHTGDVEGDAAGKSGNVPEES